uniref:Uncharacterized protein n=2 Tax=Schistosoma TaxID=6181 RepID=A0A095B2R2_SCHHA
MSLNEQNNVLNLNRRNLKKDECLGESTKCICRNTAGRLMKRKKNPSDRSVGRAIVDQMALFRRAPGPSFVPRS